MKYDVETQTLRKFIFKGNGNVRCHFLEKDVRQGFSILILWFL